MSGIDPDLFGTVCYERDEAQANTRRIREQVADLKAEIAMLRRCLSEHHAQGALDGVLVGDDCPVCKEWLHD